MERIITPVELMEDGNNELSLRPQKINEYIGQDKVKERLNVFIKAAQSRGEALDHVLLYGPPGLGKTTLANIILPAVFLPIPGALHKCLSSSIIIAYFKLFILLIDNSDNAALAPTPLIDSKSLNISNSSLSLKP